jgi:hypothetical protein
MDSIVSDEHSDTLTSEKRAARKVQIVGSTPWLGASQSPLDSRALAAHVANEAAAAPPHRARGRPRKNGVVATVATAVATAVAAVVAFQSKPEAPRRTRTETSNHRNQKHPDASRMPLVRAPTP